MSVTRRGFLKFLGAAPAAAVILPKLPEVTKFVTDQAKYKGYDYGVSVTLAKDEVVEILGPRVITTGSFAKALWPGVNKWFADAYDHMHDIPDEYK